MLKNALSNGHSSHVRGWLMVDGVQYELAQVGPDFCFLRDSAPLDFSHLGDIQADLIVEVDGNQREVAVIFSSDHSSSRKKLHYRTAQSA